MRTPIFHRFGLIFCLGMSLALLACAEAEPGSKVAELTQEESASGTASQAEPIRMVIRSATLQLQADQPQELAARATKIAKQHHGLTFSSELRSIDETATRLTMNLQVPQDAFDATLQELGGLGKVLEQTTTGEDVTDEFIDTNARIRTLQTLEERLLKLTGTTAGLKDLLEVERELARVRSEIEAKEGRAQSLKERSRMASITLIVESPRQPLLANSESLGSQFANSFKTSLRVSGAVLRGLIVALGALLPFGMLAGAAYFPLRTLRKRKGQKLATQGG